MSGVDQWMVGLVVGALGLWWLRAGLLPLVHGLLAVLGCALRLDRRWRDAARRLATPLAASAAVALTVLAVSAAAPDTFRTLVGGSGFALGGVFVFLGGVYTLLDDLTWERLRGTSVQPAPAAEREALQRPASTHAGRRPRRRPPGRGAHLHPDDRSPAAERRRAMRLVVDRRRGEA